MLIDLFNAYFRPLDVEVKYSTGTKFKVTITADAKLRVKIPRNTDSNEERDWIDRCKRIAKQFKRHPFHLTLRGEVRDHKRVIILCSDNRIPQYIVSDSKVIKSIKE